MGLAHRILLSLSAKPNGATLHAFCIVRMLLFKVSVSSVSRAKLLKQIRRGRNRFSRAGNSMPTSSPPSIRPPASPAAETGSGRARRGMAATGSAEKRTSGL